MPNLIVGLGAATFLAFNTSNAYALLRTDECTNILLQISNAYYDPDNGCSIICRDYDDYDACTRFCDEYYDYGAYDLAGIGFPEVSEYCEVCHEGEYYDYLACSPCDEGYEMRESDHLNTECEPCEAGYYSEGGTFGCEPCEPGTYQDSYSQSFCFTCDKGTYSSLGSSECTPCPVGPYGEATTTKEDWYNPNIGWGDMLASDYYACYIPANTTASDKTGTYTYSDDCYYTD